jgi:processing peptidase subunit alpha
MSIIADSVLNPAFLPEEIDLQRDAARYEIREISSKPEMIIPEILHDVAYSGRTLGNPLLCPEDRIDMVDENTIRSFMREMYRPERIVIAGAGMQHQELVELADKHFSSLKSPATPLPEHNFSSASRTGPAQPQIPSHLLSPQSPSIMKSLTRAASYLSGSTSVDSPSALNAMAASGKAVYTGGHRFIHQPDLEFNHLYLGFEGVDIHDNDIYALATMQILLGGGGSFSAGGPGKGMYSRLYTHILNHYPQIDHCASFHHIYADSSLFGLFASFFPAVAGKGHGHSQNAGNSPAQIFPHLVHQLSLLLYSPLNSQELSRAKNQLKSSLVMALESRAVEVEDLGRQVGVLDLFVDDTQLTNIAAPSTQSQDSGRRNVRPNRRG